jgi:hypothetical protein
VLGGPFGIQLAHCLAESGASHAVPASRSGSGQTTVLTIGKSGSHCGRPHIRSRRFSPQSLRH